MRLVGFMFLMAMTLMSCASKNPERLNKEQVVAEVKLMLENYHIDINETGLTAEFDYLDESPDFFWVPPGYNTALSYDSVKLILEGNAKAFRSVNFKWDTLQVFPLSNKIANYCGVVSGIMIDTAGNESGVLIIESGTIIKRSDGWKLLSGQSAALESH